MPIKPANDLKWFGWNANKTSERALLENSTWNVETDFLFDNLAPKSGRNVDFSINV